MVAPSWRQLLPLGRSAVTRRARTVPVDDEFRHAARLVEAAEVCELWTRSLLRGASFRLRGQPATQRGGGAISGGGKRVGLVYDKCCAQRKVAALEGQARAGSRTEAGRSPSAPNPLTLHLGDSNTCSRYATRPPSREDLPRPSVRRPKADGRVRS